MKALIHIDGGSRGNPGPAAAGVVIKRDDRAEPLHEAGYHLGALTNNVAEYQGLLRALELARRYGVTEPHIRSDSQLMVEQVNGRYKVKSPLLKPLVERVRRELNGFAHWELRHVLRDQNQRADELVNLALDGGRDIIATENGNPTGAEKSNPAATNTPRLEVEMRERPGESCPASCPAGTIFRFGPDTPKGMCIYAAAAVFAALDLKQRRLQPDIQCGHCGAAIQVGRVVSTKQIENR